MSVSKPLQIVNGVARQANIASVLDSVFGIVNTADNTKQLLYSLGGMTAAKTLTLASAQTTTQTLNIPNITTTDTLATLGLAQTFSGTTIFSASGTALTVNNNSAVLGSLTVGFTGTGTSGGTLTVDTYNASQTAILIKASNTNSQTYGLGMSTNHFQIFDNTATAVRVDISAAGLITLGTSGGTQTHVVNGNLSVVGNIIAPTITSTWTLTDAGAIVNATTTTKQLAFSLSGMTAARTLTLASAQTTTQTLNIPNITATDTLATLGLAQTFSAAITLSATGTALTVNNSALISGNLTSGGAISTQGYDTSTPTTGTTVTASANKPGLLLTPAGTLATLTVKLPSSPIDGQQYWVLTSQIITAITWQDAGGTAANVLGGPSTLSIGGVRFTYNLSGTKWYCEGGSGTTFTSRAGNQSISSGVTTQAVTFSSTLGTTNYAVHANLLNTTDTNPQYQPITITAQSATGFTASWNSPTATANYVLSWMAILNN